MVMESQRSEIAAGGSGCSASLAADPEDEVTDISYLGVAAEEHCYTQSSPGPSEPAAKKRKGMDDREDSVTVATKYLKDLNAKSTQRTPSSMTDVHFANFVASSMAELKTEKKKDLCRLDIMKVLMQHKHDDSDSM
ncbi:uncharacterized protein LOC129229487 [Uloborus diversus]|uniref:uncharacterized protein LOC129229487 n=1 Tax=Uloborus diversus TaxID=327109 RepID=UPI00240977E9|nr:uncharacterized protein LOC129229487 [Uloborus diversus]